MIESVEGVYAQSVLTPTIGYLWCSGTFWHLKDGCPEVERLATMSEGEARKAYEDFRVEANSRAISQMDAAKLDVLFRTALLRAMHVAPRREVTTSDRRIPGSWLVRGSSGPEGVQGLIGLPTPATRALNAMHDACDSIANGWWERAAVAWIDRGRLVGRERVSERPRSLRGAMRKRTC